MVVWLFLAVPWVCLQYVIVVFPDHTHFLFSVTPNAFNIRDTSFFLVIIKKIVYPVILQRTIAFTNFPNAFNIQDASLFLVCFMKLCTQ